MARTRAQDKADPTDAPDPSSVSPGSGQTHSRKRSQGNIQDDDDIKSPAPASKKAKTKSSTTTTITTTNGYGNGNKPNQLTDDEDAGDEATQPIKNPKIQTLLDKYGSLPLSHTTLEDPTSPTPETLLALLLSAMLSAARISHELAARTTAGVIRAGYHRLETLRGGTWEERTGVLTEGGYTRYREKTATALGDLAEFLASRYDGDLNNLCKSEDNSPPKIRKALGGINQLGNVGIDIFFDTAQGVWPCLAPFIDPRSRKTAEAIGIGSDEAVLWREVGEDPVRMCRLASALTYVRLEKKEAEFKS
ncbi:hypothetical protein VMCG_00868 [Cytospora schulzeri]|uniref:Uncharacterized protein n=1 Tax=Cytospora schulzeri TaxID=448051 RepID=A0A423X6J7_9PEZI|nr:hypothetical protein VMCG_00868 [Valsa malicola]